MTNPARLFPDAAEGLAAREVAVADAEDALEVDDGAAVEEDEVVEPELEVVVELLELLLLLLLLRELDEDVVDGGGVQVEEGVGVRVLVGLGDGERVDRWVVVVLCFLSSSPPPPRDHVIWKIPSLGEAN